MTVWYTQVWRCDDGIEFDTGWSTRRPDVATMKSFRNATLVMIVSAVEKSGD